MGMDGARLQKMTRSCCFENNVSHTGAVLVVISYMPLFLGGYVYNEEQALRRLHPAYTGDKLYERIGDHHKLIVWHDGNVKMVTLMESKWGLPCFELGRSGTGIRR